MATNIKLKSSAISGKTPTTSDLSLRELAVNTADGKLFLRKGDGSESDKIVEITAPLTTKEPNGVEDITRSTISFNNSTRIFSIAPVSEPFNIWCKGIKYSFSSAQIIQIPSTTGMYYIYFSENGILSVKTSYFEWGIDTPIAYVYWNSDDLTAYFVADERHGITMDWATHEYLHRTRGAAIAQGFSLSNYSTTGTGALNSDAQFDIENGTFFDEDLEVNIQHSNTPVSNTWEQKLQGPANIPVFYLTGNSWKAATATDYAVKQGTSRIQYNVLSGGNWTTQDVPTDTWYTTSWVIATNNINYPIICILGQSATNKITDQHSLSFLDLALPEFPVIEFRPLWKIIWQTDSEYQNTPKARIAEVYDIRELSSAGSGLPVSDHGSLTGLTDDDHLQYVHISEPRTISANHTITGNTTFSGGIKDTQQSLGLAGQYLSSTGTGVQWKFPETTNVVFVSKNGNDLNTGTSLQNPKLTIKSALQSATAGTVIKVSAGTYIEDNPLTIPSQVSIVGDSLREVSVSPANLDDLFYVENGCYVSNMSFVGSANSGAIFSFNSANPPFVTQSPYIQNCTNFIPNSTGILIDGNNAIGPLKSMVVDSYTQYNQNGFGVVLKNQAYAQLVSIFTICCDTAIICESGSACDLTNSNSSFGNYGFIADGVSPLKYTGIATEINNPNTSTFTVNLNTNTYNISSTTYDNATGILTAYTTQPHNFSVGMSIELNGLEFSCEDSPPNLIYPSGNNGYIFETKTVAPGRYVDAYNLIQANRQEIIDTAYDQILIENPTFVNPNPTKCKRDIGYIVDSVSLDVRDFTNKNTIQTTKFYFDYSGQLIANGVEGEIPETVIAFEKARDLMKLAITNNLTVTDTSIVADPNTEDNTDPASCANVQTFIDNLIAIITNSLTNENLSSLPPVSMQSTTFTVNVGTSTLQHTYVSGGTVKLNITRPFDGQVIYLDDLYYTVNKINIVSGGSGYNSVPIVTISSPSTDWGVPATAIAEVVNGSVVSIEIISSGRGYTTPPTITISNPDTGSDIATANIELIPKYYSIISSTSVSESGNCTISLSENVPYAVNSNSPIYFFKQSRVLASGHSFEYIGSGTNINTALPSVGGVPIQDNETTALNGGLVVFTSTDQSGNFRIGDGVIINQQTGTISGTFYSKSLFSTMTPFILALGGE